MPRGTNLVTEKQQVEGGMGPQDSGSLEHACLFNSDPSGPPGPLLVGMGLTVAKPKKIIKEIYSLNE